MKAEIINAVMFPSRDGYGLDADLMLDGIKAAHVHDNGDGSAYTYTVFDKAKFKAFEERINECPPYFYIQMRAELKLDKDLFIAILHEAQESKRTFNLLEFKPALKSK